tara:strand:+ start:3793 stop:10332 length:6540 start_codon:yes stop_codon:yes gene_type:complete
MAYTYKPVWPHIEIPDSTKAYLSQERDKDPKYRDYHDEQLLYELKKKGKAQGHAHEEIDKLTGTEQDDFRDLKNLKWLAGQAVDLAGDFLPDYNWIKAGYERSLTGQTRRLLSGKNKFFDPNDLEDPDNPDLNIFEDIFATALSFSMPLDWLTLKLGHMGGNFATRGKLWQTEAKNIVGAKGLGQILQKRAGQHITRLGYEGLSPKQKVMLGAIDGAFPLAAYEGSMGYVHAKVNNQDPRNEYIDPAASVAKGVIHGSILGGVLGAVNKGAMGRKAALVKQHGAKLTKKQWKNLSLLDRSAWRAAHPMAGLAIESGLFSTSQTIQEMGTMEDKSLVSILGRFAKNFSGNLGLFGLMRAQKKAVRDAYATSKDLIPSPIRDYANKTKDNIIDNVNKNIDEKYGAEQAEAREKVQAELNKQSSEFDKVAEDYIKKAEGYQKNIEYLEKKMNEAEKIAKKEGDTAGNEYFNSDPKVISIIKQMHKHHKNLINDLDAIKKLRPELSAMVEQKELELKNQEKVFENISDKMEADFKNQLDGKDAGKKDNLIIKIEALSPNARIPIQKIDGSYARLDPTHPNVTVEALETFYKELKGKGQPERAELEDVLSIQDDAGFRAGLVKDSANVKAFQEGSVQEKLRPEIAAESEKKSNPFKKKVDPKAHDHYNKSEQILKSLIQNFYARKITTKQWSGIKSDISHLRKFAKFLAERGKSFEDMTYDYIEMYKDNIPGVSGHRTAINALVKYMQRIEGGRAGTIHPTIITAEPGMIDKYFQAKQLSPEEMETAIGLRIMHVVKKGADYLINRIVPKSMMKPGIEKGKSTPITKELFDSLKKIQEQHKDVTNNSGDAYIFRDVKGNSLNKQDVNAFGAFVAGGFKQTADGARTSFLQFRKALTSRARDYEGSYLGHHISSQGIMDIISTIGLGHTTGKKLTKIYSKYGKKEANEIYTKIVEKFYKELKDWRKLEKAGANIVEENKYNMVELGKAWDKITKMKAKEKFSIDTKKPDGTIIKTFEVNKDMAKALFMFGMEVPSRLNEIARGRRTQKQRDEAENFRNTTKEEEAILDKIEKDLREANEIDESLDNFDIAVEKIKRKKLIEEEKQNQKKFLSSKEYTERVSENTKLKGRHKLEDQYAQLRGKSAVTDLRREMLGSAEYTINREATGIKAKELKIYRLELEKRIEDAKNPKGIEKELTNLGLSKVEISDVAKSFGIKNGDITRLTGKGKKIVRSMLETYNIEKMPEFSNPNDVSDIDSYDMGRKINFLEGSKKLFMAGATRLNNLSYKVTGSVKKPIDTITDIFFQLDTRINTNRGNSTWEYNKAFEVLKNKNAELVKDITWMDGNTMKEVIDIVEGRKEVESDLMPHYKEVYDRNIQAYRNSKHIPSSAEAVGKEIIRNSLDRIFFEVKDHILTANKRLKTTNPKKYKELEKYIESLYERDYLPRYFTSKAKKSYDNSIEYDVELNKIEERLLDEKIKRGLKKDKNATYQTIEEKIRNNDKELADIRGKAKSEMSNSFEALDLVVEAKEFIPRKKGLPLFIREKGTGKIIRTWENGMYDVINKYHLAMSRYSAVAEAAPEYLNDKFYKVNPETNLKLAMSELSKRLKVKHKKDYEYIENIRSELMADSRSRTSQIWRNLGTLTSSFGLSGIVTPGLKNFFLGQVQIYTTHRTSDYLKAVTSLAFSPDRRKKAYENAVKKGAIDYVVRELNTHRAADETIDISDMANKITKKTSESIYSLSGMTKAENINRIIAIETAKLGGQRAMDMLSSKFYSQSDKNEMARYLKEVSRFTKSELEFVESGEYLKPENNGRYQYLIDKIQIYGHKTTQGGVDVLDIPYWMSKKNYAPFLTFQRIAMSVTDNMVRNIIKPAIAGNIAPLVKFTLASYATGAAQYWFYDALFDKDSPASLGSEWDKALMYLWKSEFLGMFSMLTDTLPFGLTLNPYADGTYNSSIRNLTPAILRLGSSVAEEGIHAINYSVKGYGGKTFGDAAYDALVNNLVGMSQIDNLYKRRYKGEKSKSYVKYSTTRNYVKQFKRAHNIPVPGPYTYPHGQYQPFTRPLREAVYFGDEKEIEKKYMEAHNYIVGRLEEQGDNDLPQTIIKKAHEQILSSVRGMHPFAASDKTKGKFISNKEKIYNWIQEKGGLKSRQLAESAVYDFEKQLNFVESIKANYGALKKKYGVYPNL